MKIYLSFPKANNVTDLNTPEEKLNWIFTAFDTDGGGSIDVEEIKWVFIITSSFIFDVDEINGVFRISLSTSINLFVVCRPLLETRFPMDWRLLVDGILLIMAN